MIRSPPSGCKGTGEARPRGRVDGAAWQLLTLLLIGFWQHARCTVGDKSALGEFEHHVLLAALRLGDDAYTTSILTELEGRTGREVSAAAVYIALRRLERSGLVRTRLQRGTELGERRERRYVRVTATGVRMAREARRRLVRLWDGLTTVTAET